MKTPQFRRSLNALSAIVALALSGAVLAGDGSDKVKEMDTNQDGMISAEEHAAAAQMKFERMDADRDGNITAAEMDAAHQAMMKRGGMMEREGMQREGRGMHADKMHGMHADKMRGMDSNGDGMISAQEHAAGAARKFSEMDRNGDGSVTAAEIDAASQAKAGDR